MTPSLNTSTTTPSRATGARTASLSRSATRHPSADKIMMFSVVAGLLLSIFWSFEFVDSVIGGTILDGILGKDSADTALTSTGGGLVFAFVSGLAGTFTACNIAMASAIGPMNALSTSEGGAGRVGGAVASLRVLLRPLGLLALGMSVVSIAYGAVGALVGTSLPQLSTAMVGTMPVRLVQASVVFGLIGIVLIGMGMASLGVVPDPFARHPRARVIFLGALVGGFLVGRPFPLFAKLFRWAAEDGNPVAGAAAFLLQSLGNIAILTLVYGLIQVLTRGGLVRWLSANPHRTMAISGALLTTFGVFSLVYWDIRLPASFGFGWFPTMPYN